MASALSAMGGLCLLGHTATVAVVYMAGLVGMADYFSVVFNTNCAWIYKLERR